MLGLRSDSFLRASLWCLHPVEGLFFTKKVQKCFKMDNGGQKWCIGFPTLVPVAVILENEFFSLFVLRRFAGETTRIHFTAVLDPGMVP